MTKWLTAKQAAEITDQTAGQITKMGQGGRIRRKPARAPSGKKVFVYHPDDVANPQSPGTYGVELLRPAPKKDFFDLLESERKRQADRLAHLVMCKPWSKSLRLNG